MKSSLLFFTIAISFCCKISSVKSQTLPLAANLIDLNSPVGEQLLVESEARADYLPLSIHFTSQDNLAYLFSLLTANKESRVNINILSSFSL